MKVRFDVTGAIEKINALEGKGNIDAHFEVEFGVDEMGMLLEAKKSLVPEILSFVKDMQQITTERNDRDEEVVDLRDKIKNLEYDLNTEKEKNEELESDIKSLNIRLEGEKERHEVTKKNRDEYFNKYIKTLDNENKRIQRETEEIRKRSQDSRKTQKQEEDDDELY